jgi:hypothetical protein
VRSYRTVSPLPASRQAVCFLLHFPASHLDWPLTSTLPCEARTFLSRRRSRAAASDHLGLSAAEQSIDSTGQAALGSVLYTPLRRFLRIVRASRMTFHMSLIGLTRERLSSNHSTPTSWMP